MAEMTIARAVRILRNFIGDRNEHHHNCATRFKKACDCYTHCRVLPHKALDRLEFAVKWGALSISK